jgi:hypothetical protein
MNVTVILLPDAGVVLRDRAAPGHVWVVATPANVAQAEAIRASSAPSDSHSLTTFTASPEAQPSETCEGFLDTIDLHHGPFSQDPSYTGLEVLGATLTSSLRAALEGLGFPSITTSEGGFVAVRNTAA